MTFVEDRAKQPYLTRGQAIRICIRGCRKSKSYNEKTWSMSAFDLAQLFINHSDNFSSLP